MLGEMIAVKAGAVVGFEQLEPVGVELAERGPCVVHVVEHTELHADPPRLFLRCTKRPKEPSDESKLSNTGLGRGK
jgi:hypothetical protein